MLVIRYEKTALGRMQPKLAARFRERLQEIARSPLEQHPNVKQLVGIPGFRLRAGDWRAVFRFNASNQELIVEAIEPRGRIYR